MKKTEENLDVEKSRSLRGNGKRRAYWRIRTYEGIEGENNNFHGKNKPCQNKASLHKSVEGGQFSILQILGTSSSDLSAFPDNHNITEKLNKSIENSSKGDNDMDFKKAKKWVVDHLKRQMRDEDRNDRIVTKALVFVDAYGMRKSRGFPVGTVKEWKGKKYKKISPGKWVRFYDKSGRGTNQAIRYAVKKAMAAESFQDLYKVIAENKERFIGSDNRLLPEAQAIITAAKASYRGKQAERTEENRKRGVIGGEANSAYKPPKKELNEEPKRNDSKAETDAAAGMTNMDEAVSKITKSKFSKYVNESSVEDFVSHDGSRWVMEGTYCDRGFKVATDSKFMAVLKEDYPPEDEGKIVKTQEQLERQRKYRGEEGYGDRHIDGQFPAYERVIPDEDRCNEIPVDVDDLLKRCMVANSIKAKRDILKIKVGDAVYDTEMMARCLAIAKQRGMKFYQPKDNAESGAGMFRNDKGECCLLMPMNDGVANIDESGNIGNLTPEQENKLSGGAKETTRIKLEKMGNIEMNFFNRGARDIMNFFHEKRGFEPIKKLVAKKRYGMTSEHNYGGLIMNPEHMNGTQDYAQAMNDLKDLYAEFDSIKKKDMQDMKGSDPNSPAKGRHSSDYKKFLDEGIQRIKDKYGIEKSLDFGESVQKPLSLEFEDPESYEFRKSVREELKDIFFVRGYSA